MKCEFFIIQLTDLYYCQKDYADEKFESFCGNFLPNLSVKELEIGEPIPRRLFMVLNLPCYNRQNNVDVLSDIIRNIVEKYRLQGNVIDD